MRPLRTCDFCDADAAGAFEIVPPELEPTEAEQRRVVCCDDCKTRLENLLEPLLARAGAAGIGAGADSTPETEADTHTGTVVAAADESTQKQKRTSSPNATVSGSDADKTPDSNSGAESATDTTTDADRADSSSESGLENDTGITFERSESAESDDSSEKSDDNGRKTDESTETDASDTETEADASDTTADESATQTSGSRPPKAYGKVRRLLRNREFPMKRSAVENLAAGAYDLESHEVDAIIDYALEEGEFVEKRGKLRRP
ncbi:hypothetical protein GS429_02225 [Natronorubrum sp. JWXQ-INN-674]|uniref:Uncharacterized protein n=1 Tax=Natronorubrum halalkaliphilum TaxID=2691917 RepID=A0A6B0VIJ3_9EURY|nr:hypothetical protein [Natronorubrum halalkaliphilum]MXV60907.1 hypothetical protein [Natronorubrum halalkaliphilum]